MNVGLFAKTSFPGGFNHVATCRPIATASERTLSLLTHDAAIPHSSHWGAGSFMILLSFLTPEDIIISRERVRNRELNVSGLQLVIVDDVGVLCFSGQA